ncbi:hypothetical protein Tco_0360110 [Tanacetum coccineum]
MVCMTDILAHSHAPYIILSLPDDRDLHCSDCGWRNVFFCHLTFEFFLIRVSTQALIPLGQLNSNVVTRYVPTKQPVMLRLILILVQKGVRVRCCLLCILAFSSLIDIIPTTLDHGYDVELAEDRMI